MERAYNFNPGPCGLPDEVMRQAQEEFLCFGNEGASVMEISHRGATFMKVYEDALHLMRELLGIGDDYAVLFLPGGATGQAVMAPMNLLPDDSRTAAYLITGYWSWRAAQEAKKFCRVEIAADTSAVKYVSLPREIAVSPHAGYVHYADNETIHGVEFPAPPKVTPPLVADMSSNIMSRPINISDYGMIYAGAQKNLGPAGIAVVIVRKDLLNPRANVPMVWDCGEQIKNDSMANTPPTFLIYMLGLVLKWAKKEGGVKEFARRSQDKARMLYQCIDEGDFYRNNVSAKCRSRMNVPFFLKDDSLTADFLQGATENGMIGLKGHALIGGCRASIYNSMPVAGVKALTDYMRDFAKRKG